MMSRKRFVESRKYLITGRNLLLLGLLIGCSAPNADRPSSVVSVEEPGATISFLGAELPPVEISESTQARFEENLATAKSDWEANPDSLELIIWYGRRLAYLGRYQEAIDVYTGGLERYPQSYRLFRHRGHRYISTREIDLAISDYEMAAFHSTNAKNQIEPDGLPNKLNIPLGNDKFNIFYHFGLAHYLSGRFDKAVSAYRKCLDFSDNDDLLAATSYWLYMSALRVGNTELAEAVISKITPQMELIENVAYHDLLLLFKGIKTEQQLLSSAKNEDGGIDPTRGYGIGYWYLQMDRANDAEQLFKKILEGSSWSSFGYIAAEADVKNLFTSSD